MGRTPQLEAKSISRQPIPPAGVVVTPQPAATFRAPASRGVYPAWREVERTIRGLMGVTPVRATPAAKVDLRESIPVAAPVRQGPTATLAATPGPTPQPAATPLEVVLIHSLMAVLRARLAIPVAPTVHPTREPTFRRIFATRPFRLARPGTTSASPPISAVVVVPLHIPPKPRKTRSPLASRALYQARSAIPSPRRACPSSRIYALRRSTSVPR